MEIATALIATVIAIWQYLSPSRYKWLVVCLMLVFLGGSIYKIYQGEKEKSAVTMEGVLESSRSGSGLDIEYPALEIGNNGTRLAFIGDPNKEGDNQFKLGDAAVIEVALMNGELRVSADIFGSGHNLIAQIIDNEWKINPAGVWDRNYDKSALEIIDRRGKVAFQVKMVNAIAQVQIWLEREDGSVMYAIEAPGGALMGARAPGKTQPKAVLRRMFKYPSKTHLHELAR